MWPFTRKSPPSDVEARLKDLAADVRRLETAWDEFYSKARRAMWRATAGRGTADPTEEQVEHAEPAQRGAVPLNPLTGKPLDPISARILAERGRR